LQVNDFTASQRNAAGFEKYPFPVAAHSPVFKWSCHILTLYYGYMPIIKINRNFKKSKNFLGNIIRFILKISLQVEKYPVKVKAAGSE